MPFSLLLLLILTIVGLTRAKLGLGDCPVVSNDPNLSFGPSGSFVSGKYYLQYLDSQMNQAWLAFMRAPTDPTTLDYQSATFTGTSNGYTWTQSPKLGILQTWGNTLTCPD